MLDKFVLMKEEEPLFVFLIEFVYLAGFSLMKVSFMLDSNRLIKELMNVKSVSVWRFGLAL